MAVLTFDEEKHEYRLGSLVVPSVTQVLSKLHDFSMVPKEVLEAAQERGTYVHLLTQFHDERDLAPESIVGYEGYLDAWVAFCAAHRVKWADIEYRGHSERYGFAGTMDRRGWLGATRYVIDIKTAAQSHRVWGLQTAAYRQICAEQDPAWITARRGTVQLRPNGTFKFLPWDAPSDWPAFLSLINLSHWINEK